jgi:GT2 family glycosyltransferase
MLHRDERSEVVIQNLHGGSVAITREGYEAIGGLDEDFVGWGGEDNEFWDRAETLRSTRFGYLPIVHLWHAPQFEKLQANDAPAVKRYRDLGDVSPQERIARLRGS